MHFVAALDRIRRMRCVLALFEGVATGAADGYARMDGKPAATLLHLGARPRATGWPICTTPEGRTPVVNIVGDHATYHRDYDAPLTSDIERAARPFSRLGEDLAVGEDSCRRRCVAVAAAAWSRRGRSRR